MPRKPWGAVARMGVGSVLGILGFGAASLGFVDLAVLRIVAGLFLIGMGTVLALGVTAPLRRPSGQ